MLSFLLSSVLLGAVTGSGPDLPLAFVARGGPDATPVFEARGAGWTARVEPDGLRLGLTSGAGVGRQLALRLEGARGDARLAPAGRRLGPVRSYRGRDPAGWDTRGEAWSAVRATGVAAGVDLLVLERHGLLSYDLELAPGADLDHLVLRCEGADGLALSGDGLRIDTPAGPVHQTAPVAWQLEADGGRRPVAVRFRLIDERRYGFVADGLDADLPLVVDPGLQFGGVLGGSAGDGLKSVALDDGSGHLLVTGTSSSPDLPTSGGAHQAALAGLSDVVVARIDPVAGQLVWATYLGGNDSIVFRSERGEDLALLDDGSLVITGTTTAADFPTTAGVAQPTSAGGDEAFVARLGSDGSLTWSTLLGGGRNDVGEALAVDAAGRVVVAGTTFSDDFPVTPGAFDESFNSIFFTNDLFVARLAADGSAVEWATYVGGSLRDEARDLVLDGADRPLVIGLSGSVDLPTTPGAYDESFNGAGPSETDAVALRLSADGSGLDWCSFVGSVDLTEGCAAALGPAGELLLAGQTRGADFPTTAGALQPAYAGGTADAFLCALSGDGASLLWSTFLGGADADAPAAVAVDAAGQPTVVGWTRSADLLARLRAGQAPDLVAPGGSATGGGSRPGSGALAPAPGATPPVQPEAGPGHGVDGLLGGGQDAFVLRLGADGGSLVWASFYGGSGVDQAAGLALTESGAAWVVGESDSADLPLTADAPDDTPNGGMDGFLARFAIPPVLDLGFGLEALGGPRLGFRGSLRAGSPWSLELEDAPAAAPVLLLIGSEWDGCRPGGALWGWAAVSGPQGQLGQAGRWPADVPPGTRLVLQALVPGATSNGLALIAP